MLTLIAVFAPLIGAVLAGVARPFIGKQASIGASILFMAVSAVAGVASLVTFVQGGVPVAPLHIVSWISVGSFSPGWTLRQDALSLVMVAMVSTVSMLIHVYSAGYMAHDKTVPRFFAYLSLFTFAMLMLVTANNLLQLYFGWEGVGLVSYLLIGYWYERPSANAAAIKAFIVNRVGDLSFAVGIALTYFVFKTISFDGIFAAVAAHAGDQYMLLGTSFPALEVVCILLFIGAMGKSAQIFLHTWLADAMEGPTPVSALIHAATMVAAGVFLIARISPLLNAAPVAMDFVTIIGATTALFAGTVGCLQNDIKRIIAYSTCSQLGYMFLAAGLGAYPVAMFHLINHAFFKALLFLAAGSVIHAMSDEQDIRLMGGLARKLPITWLVMLVGALALAGIPPFAGYYSKDAILDAAFGANTAVGMYGWVCGVITAGLTAFYISRLFLLTFHGSSRAPKHVQEHVHESPLAMLAPLVLLAIGALSSGFLLKNSFIGDGFASFWGSSIAVPANGVMNALAHPTAVAEFSPLVASVSGIFVAIIFYILVPSLPAALSQNLGGLYRFVLNKWYFDELYDAVFVKPALRLAKFAWHFGDEQVLDGVPNGLATLTTDASLQTVKLQTGSIALYAFIMLIGLLAFVSLFLWVR
ncbi:NADH:ubiquinone oxidoreductase subunit L [Acidocella aquatica]|uniref:NADH:ubiquinone oxidoreductase subunit L n=1 Tax=Acidocella aquatica TaxID=1922313 RepID=A0ABQ6A156_9PROT|nr:NADH-quinone oxidoreductase subunit L [Acidocella aquatica]GLR66175.1 NADH:ubiquinone oxidoreductase subunit L [Acidocella aquatica]